MALRGRSPQATIIALNGYDPHRLYYDIPVSGGWRECRDPISGRRYWNLVNMNLTSWSLVEVLRLNALEEFLLLGEWTLFTVIPEKLEEYEDPGYRYNIFSTVEMTGQPIEVLKPGTVVTTVGMPKPGIVEILLPDADGVAKLGFAKYRWPPQDGTRYLQRLPARMRTDDVAGMNAVVTPVWVVLEPVSGTEGPEEGDALLVTEGRDPRSEPLGWLKVGTSIGLNLIEGTRALVGWIHEDEQDLVDGWISFVRLDGSPTLRRVLEEFRTTNQKIQRELQEHLKELEAAGMSPHEAIEAIEKLQEELAGDSRTESRTSRAGSKLPSRSGSKLSARSGSKLPSRSGSKLPSRKGSRRTSRGSRRSSGQELQLPKLAFQFVGPPSRQEQRETVVGGWRQIMDPVWNRPLYVSPVNGRTTWGVNEVIRTGGLDDLLLNRSWDLCCIDPEALEIQKQDDWCMNVYADSGLSGEPIARWEKGRLIVTQMFDDTTGIATVLVPPTEPGGDAATGYVKYSMRDGRPLLKAMVAPVEDPPELVEGQLMPGAKPPDDEFLEGPFFAVLPLGKEELIVTVGQDVGSDSWARLPRGYRLRCFAEILGFRARLPDLEGGGWVSLCTPQGFPHFRKQPSMAPEIELPEEVGSSKSSSRRKGATIPIVWPGIGVLWPEPIPVPVPKPQPKTLPELLSSMVSGRALCDWQRMALPPYQEMVWKNRHAPSITRLHELLRLKIWKPAVVEAEYAHIREAEDERSRHIVSMSLERGIGKTVLKVLPLGSLVITQWVSPGGSVRVVVATEEDDPSPGLGWTDLGGADGAALTLLTEGTDFWVEPQGGHIAEEDQQDESEWHPAKMQLRETKDPDSQVVGNLQRGDVVQIAEIDGRLGRVVRIKAIEETDSEAVGGWMDLYTEAGWSCLRKRFLGQVHPEEVRRLDQRQKASKVEEQLSKETISRPSKVPVAEDEEEDELAELPALLKELGELEAKSIYTRDWREAIDPVWGRRYFVNRWSGQVIHHLVRYGVAEAAVKLTIHFTNLSLHSDGLAREEFPERKIASLERSAVSG
eukprot:s907_g1.t3